MDEKDEKIEFGKRFTAAVEEADYEPRPSVVERHFNSRYWGKPVTFQAVRRWLRGESIPEQDKLVVLAEWLQVEAHELRYGVPGNDESKGDKPWYTGLSVDEYELIQALLDLPAPKRKVVKEVIDSFSAQEEGSSKPRG